jgi:Zn ribbon nucleic-acid-binding protein
MSKRIEAKITCPNCSNQFDFTLYRSIWGEYPENRELVMTNQINVASCPSCNHATKLQYPFIYTNANQHFVGRYALRILSVCKVRRTNWICNFSLSSKRTRQTNRNDNLRWTCFAISTVFQNCTWQTNVEYS